MAAVSKSRLLATSAIAGLAMLQMSSPAGAQVGDYGRFVPEGQQATIDNPAGETIEGDKNGVRSSGSALTLTNEGTIRGNGHYDGLEAPPEGGVLVDGGPATITNSGVISGGGHGISTAYFYNPNTQLLEGRAIGVSVHNSGTIAGEDYDGIRLIGGGDVANSGQISGGYRPDAVPTSGDGVSMFAYDDQDLSGVDVIGTLTNEAGGTIDGMRYGAIISGGAVVENDGAITGLVGGLYVQTNTTEETGKIASVTNGGTISGGNGVTFGSNLESSELVNSGTISGTSGFAIANGSYGRATITNEEGGVIEGATIGVYDDEGGIDLINAGTIRGNGSYDGFDEPPHAGVTILGAPSTVDNSGTISGAGAGITTAYYYNVETDQIEGRATDTAVTNSGTISGESNDGIRLIGGGSVTNSGAISGAGRGDADGISMYAYTDQAPEDYSALVTNEAEGTISGERFGIILSGGGDVANAGDITGIVGGVFIQGTALDSDDRSGVSASVVNSGTIHGTGNLGGSDGDGHGLVFGSDMASATLDNSGDITSDFGAGVVQGSLADVTITNTADGVITGGTSGVYGSSGGTLALVNAGTIRGNGSYDGFDQTPDAGVTIGTASSSVTNSGTISGAGAGITTAYAFDEDLGDFVGQAVGTVIDNSGTISGEFNDGVRLIGGGSVTNSGTISGAGRTDADGISMYAFTDQANEDYSALVTNEADGAISGDRFGIILSGGGDVDNAGEITGAAGGVFIQGTALNTDASEDRSGLSASVVNTGSISGTGDFGGTYTNGFGVGFGSDMSTASLVNSGSISSAFAEGVSQGSLADLTISNEEGGTIEGGTSGIYGGSSGTMTIDNAGTIRGNGAYDGFDAPPDAGITIGTASSSVTNSGTISGAGAGITTTMVFDEDLGQLVGLAVGTAIDNSGAIAGEGNDGVRLMGGGSVANSGTISGAGSAAADGISMYAFSDQASADYSALVTNEAGGAIGGERFGIILSGGGDVANAGDISGGDGGVFIQGTALDSGDRSGLTASLVNSGTITGTRADGLNGYGVGFGSDLATASLDNSGSIVSEAGAGVFHGTLGDVTITNAADGVIEGGTHGIYAGGDGSLTLTNEGTIRGNGSYEGNDAPADAGVMIQSAGAVIENSGTISSAGQGIVTQLYFNEDTGQLEARATGTELVNSGTIIGETNDAVRLFGGGSVTNSGTIEGLAGDMTDGVTIQAFGGQDTSGQAMLGSVVNEEGGTIAGVRYGVLAVSGASVTNAGTISGGLNGVVIGKQSSAGKAGVLVNSGTIEGGALIDVDTATADNSGTIASDTGVAFSSLGQIAFVNSGTLTGGAGVAATLSAFDDSVTLKTGSAITGLVDAGDGVDSLTLDGDVLELTTAQQIGASANFETLEVANGYWTSAGYVGEFDSVAIAEGAALQVNEVDLGGSEGRSSPIETGVVTVDGRLILNFSEDDAVSALDALSITGAGSLELIGDAVFTVDTDTVAHSGGTTIAGGGLVLTGTLLGDVTTEGDGTFTLGAGGTEGAFAGDIVNNGRFVFNRSDDYDFAGAFSGTGTLDKLGAGTLSFTGDYDFDGVTNILAGSVRIGGMIDPETDFNVGGGSLDLSGNDQTIGGLAGEQGANVNIGANQLTVNQDENSEYAGAITGTGGFVKTGSGTLNLSGTNSYTGPTTIGGGKLAVNGSITSPVFVNAGGALGGNGTVGSTNVGSGGAIAPGNSIGRLTVAGDLAFAAGSTYEVEVNAAGQADRIDATGTVTIDSGAGVAVMAADGNYAGRTDYVILTGAGGIDGSFGSVTSDLAFLDPLLRYSADTVTLSLYRNDVDFADVAVGANQAAVAGAIQSRGIDDPLFEAVVNQNAAGARAAYGDLSGEIVASTISGLTDDSRYLRGALLGMNAPEASGAFVWGSAFGGWGDFAPDGGASGMDTDHKGFVAGFGYGGNGFAAALSAGIGSSDFDLGSNDDRAKVDSKYLAAHAVYGTGEGLRAALGLAYAWHDVDTTRAVRFAPLAQSLTSSRDADTLQLFGELGYDVTSGDAAITPFARLAYVQTDSDAFVEAGGEAALAVADATQDTTFLSLGVRARANAGGTGFQPYVSAAWNGAMGDRGAAVGMAFASGGTPFAITGVLIPKSSAEIEAGFDYTSGAVTLGAGYMATLGSDRDTQGVRITARFSF